jgi:hypothetical protein
VRGGSKASIFLADVTDDLDLRRNEVRDYLEQAGFKVLPESWRPYDDLAAFEAAVDRDLAQCTLFAQLLSEVPGKSFLISHMDIHDFSTES